MAQTTSASDGTGLQMHFERGDTLYVRYTTNFTSGTASMVVNVEDIEEVFDGIYEVDIRRTDDYKPYTLVTSDLGISVRTRKANEEDNVSIGTDATVVKVE